MLRRTKQVVDVSIPPREELVVRLPLTPLQRFWYLLSPSSLLITQGVDTLGLKVQTTPHPCRHYDPPRNILLHGEKGGTDQ